MSWSERAIRRPVATAMVFVALTVLGALSYTRLQVDLFPELDFPSISVVTTYPGVSPEEVETLITRPIEAAVARVEGIDRIESFSAEGRSRVALRFTWGMELDEAMNEVRSAVERVRGSLPDEADAPVVFRFNLTNLPVASLAIESNMEEVRLRRFADDVIRPYLERVSGIASVDVRGARDREIRVELDAERLSALELAPSDVTRAVSNGTATVAAGRVEVADENILIRALAEYESTEAIGDALILERNGVPIRVRDVADVVDDAEEATTIVRINGVEGVRASVQKSPDANTVEVSDRLREAVATFNRDYAGVAQLRILEDNSIYIRRSIEGVRTAILAGAGLAVLVLLLFLRDLRATFVIAASIPISIIGTFLLMKQLDLTLNLITFGGLALGLGMLVDGAIVILENIYRRQERGESPLVAAIEGSREVASAITAGTMTTLVVFVPVIFLGGFAAVFFQQMALVVSAALLCSLVVALTLVPVLASLLLKQRRPSERRARGPIGALLDVLDRTYARVVDRLLDQWILVVLLGGLLLGGAYHFGQSIGSELLPTADESEVAVFIRYPAGTRMEVTEAAVRRVEAIVEREVPEATEVLSSLGSPGFWSSSGEEFAYVDIFVVPVEERARSSAEIADAIRAEVVAATPGSRTGVRAGGGLWVFRFLRGGDDRLRVEIRGHDLQIADRLAAQVVETVVEVEGVTDARASRQPGGREVRLSVDRERAADAGLTTREVAELIGTLVQGTQAARYREAGDEFAVRVRLSREDLQSTEGVLATPVALPDGRSVPLRALVRVSDGTTPLDIDRYNQERIVTVGGGLEEGVDLGAVNAAVREALSSINVPEGYSVIVAGESAEQNSAFTSLGLGIVLALILVFMVMAAQFESFVHPVVILISVPFASIGVVAVLVATDTTLNLNSLMGCIVLVGVVVNNAIVLVDYINQMRREGGVALREAVVESSRRRLRPILMTTATTVLALLPVALGGGTGGENQTPLARVVVGGLLASTLVTLALVPVVYYRVETWRARWFGVRGASDVVASPADAS